MLQDARVRWTLIAIFVIGLAGAAMVTMNNRRTAPPPIVVTGPDAVPAALPVSSAAPGAPPAVQASVPISRSVETPAPEPALPALIYVHVAGAVKHPSLYQIAPGSRVWHAIKAAGGPMANADEDAVNLAAKVHDGEKIFVPTKAAAGKVAASAPPAAAEDAAAPMPAAGTASAAAGARKNAGARAAASGKPTKLVSPSQGQVNINTASAEQLQTLPGIGPAMAGRIIGYRQQSGGFQKTDDLMSVGGIGPKKFARLEPLVKLH